jgi:hypothetical protein
MNNFIKYNAPFAEAPENHKLAQRRHTNELLKLTKQVKAKFRFAQQCPCRILLQSQRPLKNL